MVLCRCASCMYGNGTGAWTNFEFGMIHLLYFIYLTQYFAKQSVHSLFFYDLFSVSPSCCFTFFPFWYCLCHYHSWFLCSWHIFHIYFSYSETFCWGVPVLMAHISHLFLLLWDFLLGPSSCYGFYFLLYFFLFLSSSLCPPPFYWVFVLCFFPY